MNKERMPKININNDTHLYIEQIAIGGFAPLEGFMNKQDYESVVEHKRLANNQVWTVPIALSVERSVAKKCVKGSMVSLIGHTGNEAAVMNIESVYSYDKMRAARAIYGTTSMHHPGVKHLIELPEIMLGGKVKMIQKPLSPYPECKLTPSQTRRIFKERGWKAIAAFHTRNVPHRAHEYLQRTALELVDGLIIQPFVGRRKDGDFSAELVLKGYRALIENYYPKNRALLACLEIPMAFAGPREAVFHAIIRRNYGCTHFIVGRDHAGVANFYDKYAAHRIFDELPGIGITLLKLQGPFYCAKCKAIATDNSCGHDESLRTHISGTMIRHMISKHKTPPPEIMRPEVSRVILKN